MASHLVKSQVSPPFPKEWIDYATWEALPECKRHPAQLGVYYMPYDIKVMTFRKMYADGLSFAEACQSWKDQVINQAHVEEYEKMVAAMDEEEAQRLLDKQRGLKRRRTIKHKIDDAYDECLEAFSRGELTDLQCRRVCRKLFKKYRK